MIYAVFFAWERTRVEGPADLGPHCRRLAWSWALFAVVLTLGSVWSVGFFNLETTAELVAFFCSQVMVVALAAIVAAGFSEGTPRVRLARLMSFLLFVSGSVGVVVACYTWWALVNEGRPKGKVV